MRIEATVKHIRALVELAEADSADQPAAEARRQGRDTLARRVPRQLLDPYQLLLEVGRAPVVVAVQRGICLGCHVRLPTMLEYEIRRSPAIHRCPHCRRMLYVPELVGDGSKLDEGKAPRRAAAGSRS